MRSVPHPLPGRVTAFHPATRVSTPRGRRQPARRPVSLSHGVVAWCLSPPCPCCSDRCVVLRSRSFLSCPGACPRTRGPFVSCSNPSSRGYSPPGRLLHLGAGPLDPFPARDPCRGRNPLLPFLSWDRCSLFFRVLWRPWFLVPRLHPMFISHLAASNPVARVCFLVFLGGSFFCAHLVGRLSPPLPLCLSVPCPVVSFLLTLLPACTHDTAALVVCCCGSSEVTSRVLLRLRGVPLGGPRPSKVGAPLFHHPLSPLPAPPHPPLRASQPSPLLLLSSPSCAARLLYVPGLCLARPRASLRLRSILRPVGRPHPSLSAWSSHPKPLPTTRVPTLTYLEGRCLTITV